MRIFARAQRRESVFHARESVYRAETHCKTLCCSVLQCVAVCCSLLQCTRTSECVPSRDTLQHTSDTATHSAQSYSTLHRAETHCNTLLTLQHTPHTATHSAHIYTSVHMTELYCNTLLTLQRTLNTATYSAYTLPTLQYTPGTATYSSHCIKLR